MPTNTTKFNLVKPLKSEKYNVDVFNGNADIIDSQIYSKSEVDTSLGNKVDKTTTVNSKALSSNITINAGDVPNTPSGNISAITVQNAINELDNEKANRVQEAWITPTLLNGWVDISTLEKTRYFKDQFGIVHVEVCVKSGTANSNIFLLPSGYRPSQQVYKTGLSGSALGVVACQLDGNIVHFIGVNTSNHRISFSFKAV